MNKVETSLTKYVFLDIVGFTKGRSVEAQSDIVEELNNIVKLSIESKNLQSDQIILLPTGDGICIALIECKPFDIHLLLAIDIIKSLFGYNNKTHDTMRQFKIRIGVNENIDNIIIDINARKNIAGMGINVAQRIMNLSDGNQILISQTVFEIIQGREKYMKAFKKFDGSDKHGNSFPVYQLIDNNYIGVDTDIPTVFKPRIKPKEKLSKYIAHYLSHAIRNKDFLLSQRESSGFEYTATVLLRFKAQDSLEKENSSPYEKPTQRTYGNENTSFAEQYDFYHKQDFWSICELHYFVVSSEFKPYNRCFVSGQTGYIYAFVNDAGEKELQSEWPDIYNKIVNSTQIATI